jgi:glycosyltransferase involved in cell wall biosynthesis
MKKVLIIAYYFPPMGGAAAQRNLKFVKYLRRFGWEPVVLTHKELRRFYFAYDRTLLDEIPEGTGINRVWGLEHLAYLLFGRLGWKIIAGLSIPDPGLFWIPAALLRARKIIRENKIEVVFTVGPPHSPHVLGLLLKKLFKIKWVAEYQDPWTQYQFYKRNELKARLERRLEAVAHSSADLICTVTQGDKKKFIDGFDVSPEKIHVLPNGYDEDDFRHGQTTGLDRDKFNVVYTGAFYSGYRPDPFLRALGSLVSNNPALKSHLLFHFAGTLEKNMEEEILAKIKEQNLTDATRYYGYVPHSEAIRLITNADLLLLILWQGKTDTWIPAKTFEYLRAGRPILAIVPTESECADLVRKLKAGVIVDPSDTDGIQRAISDSYNLWKEGKLAITPDWEEVRKYEREYLAGRLAALFEQVTLNAGG